jgi:hypothetical protein
MVWPELSATALYIVHTILWFFHSKKGCEAVVGWQAETGKRVQFAVCLERGERERGRLLTAKRGTPISIIVDSGTE